MCQGDGTDERGGAAPPIDPAAPQHIEAASEPGEEDEFDTTEGYETGSSGSTSATSSIYAHTYEHGRRYHQFKNGRYPIPNDNEEQSREDMKHAMLLELMDGELFYAPIGENPQQILDVGTGTGIWAIDVGDRYPSARVRGIDLSPIQPLWVPPNVDFVVDDCEKDFLTRECDLIHFRFMVIILKAVATVLENAYQALKPGGWIELQELCAEPLCDDGTMPDNDPVKVMYDMAAKAFAKFGANVTLAKNLESQLREAGFENIQCIVKKVPIGVWAKDKTLRLIGLYQKYAVLDLMSALAGRPFEALGLSQVESQVILAHARRGLEDSTVHRYFNYYFWYAQKPQK
ncbi:Methyltransferase type 11 [Pleurostoma richardsiae]|uniref:Methyltransferase type 11 n=1 Tax=Pleurostoma richardsiae TaxID=41990 RepID=A0AA38VZE2_9PEZI|nr:Methyltransferase type 11 [Pleurostoma richardsiae]